MLNVSKFWKLRGSRDLQADPGEPVWNNGCEVRGCRVSSVGNFIMCNDGIAREFCTEHQDFVTDPTFCSSCREYSNRCSCTTDNDM